MIRSFLMIGQSNMAGRGFLRDVTPICDEHIKVLRNGRWHMMFEPVNYDRPSAGIGPAASFAAAWRLEHPDGEIGLIPCADGGTSLDDWAVGGQLFDHAVAQAKLAQRISRLDGILWHQGESDCFPERALVYGEKLGLIIEALRRELDAAAVPLIAGGLGEYLTSGIYGSYFTTYPQVNDALERLTLESENCYFVTAAGLTSNPDGVHTDAHSQRLFGIRYFEAYHQLKSIPQPLPGERDTLERINQRPLTLHERRATLENQFSSGQVSMAEFQKALGEMKP
jgi:hypothetical protein